MERTLHEMNWSNVKLILLREVRDQLRDRRTLFMIFVLPVMLYPLLGASFFQMAQFIREQPAKVLLLGRSELPGSPALVEQHDGAWGFAPRLFTDLQRARLLEVHFDPPADKDWPIGAGSETLARYAVQQGGFEIVIDVPRGFSARLDEVRRQVAERRQAGVEGSAEPPKLEASATPAEIAVPSPKVYYNTAKEKSAIAYARVSEVLHQYTTEVARENLAAGGVPAAAARPFDLASDDVAESLGMRGAALWSKILPFLLLLWALTGAFYPAVDLCAGEKERGTLETLLSSPAERGEIVWGKLFTIMLFSMATAVLNLASMGLTGELILSHLPRLGPPPPLAPLWLMLALVPVSALFSALCLALAAFARSSKEGQYYLMPLVLVIMPLVVLPMSPGFELNLGNSLIPVTGVMLVLRSLLEGNYWEALPYVPVVTVVTLAGCLLAIRWAIDQFNQESVLFRESERLNLGLWLRHLLRDREDTPTAAQAIFCGVLILLVQFVGTTIVSGRQSPPDLVTAAVVTQLAMILTPALLMTVMLTRSPRKTLLLRLPAAWTLPAAVLLAVVLHPAAGALQVAVLRLYPISDEVKGQLEQIFSQGPSFGVMLLIVAVIPAICEELAFRGFILSGLRRLGHKRQAILISAIFFGMAHSILQQSLIAGLLGLIIGYLAVQTGSLLPGVLFHMTHNSLALLAGKLTPQCLVDYPALRYLVHNVGSAGQEEYMFHSPIVALGGLAAIAILVCFRHIPYSRSPEEALQDALEHQTPQPAVG
jgi:sodium transport system permease protein